MSEIQSSQSRVTELERRLDRAERKSSPLRRWMRADDSDDDSFLWGLADVTMLILIFFVFFYSQAVGQDENRVAEDATIPGTEAAGESVLNLRQQVFEQLSPDLGVGVRIESDKLILELAEDITFNSGEAALLEDFKPKLRQITDFISARGDYKVTVSGHTDNAPIKTTQFPSNWELSTARAVGVARFLMSHGVDARRIVVEGHGEFRPRRPNQTASGRAANRRVEITLSPS